MSATLEKPEPTEKPDSLTPLTTGAELAEARTSHLDGFKPLKTSVELAEDEVVELPEQKFPKTIKATLDILESTRAESPATPREQKLKALKLSAISKHLSDIQQVPTAKPLTNAQHTSLAGVQTNHAEEIQLEQMAQQFPIIRKAVNRIADLEKQISELTKQKTT
jgi:hypothetical protein